MTWIGRTAKDAAKARLIAAGDTTTHYLGAQYLLGNHAPPRYVWVGRTDAPSAKISKIQTNPPAIYAFEEGLSIHCWGLRATATDDIELDYDSAYTLSRNVLTALRAEYGADLTVLQSGFLRPEQEGWIKHGQVYVLNVAISVPSIGAIVPTVEITGHGHEGVMGFPAGDYVAC